MLNWQHLQKICLLESKKLNSDIIFTSNSIEIILQKKRFSLINNEDGIYWHVTNLVVTPWFSKHGILTNLNDISSLIEKFSIDQETQQQ